MALTQVDQGLLGTNAQYTGFKNRIINGAMVIDQRNAGASTTPSASTYTLDRWKASMSVASKFSVQQSFTAPTGFINSYVATSLSAYTIGASETTNINQNIEGLNVSDLGWGTASASTVTLSFWVRSSLTGTFGGSVRNSAADRSYPFSYTISSANTWEQKSITIAGDTSGTWLTTNGIGMIVLFSLGTGSTLSGTANSWAAGNYVSATGATSVVGTNGATFYLTGVQLEKGSTATSFDYRPYSAELAMCQRYYYQHIYPVASSAAISLGIYYTSSQVMGSVTFPVTMRVSPTISAASGTGYYVMYSNGSADQFNSVSLEAVSPSNYIFRNTTEASGTAGYAGEIQTNSSSAAIGFSSEL